MGDPLDHITGKDKNAIGRTEAGTIADLAAAAAEPTELDITEIYGVSVPAGSEHKVIDLEQFLAEPRRARGTVALETVESLLAYVNRHDDEKTTTLWVNGQDYRVAVVIDDHPKSGLAATAGWGEHRAQLRLVQSPEWLHWTGLSGELVDQVKFAEHIEDGLLNVVDPDGATLLEIAQSLSGSRTAQFQSASRLRDGNVGLAWVEETTARAGERGDIEIPERFVLNLAPFIGEHPVAVNARLRWRLREGKVSLGYKLEQPHLVTQAAMDGIALRLANEFGEARVFFGTPRGA